MLHIWVTTSLVHVMNYQCPDVTLNSLIISGKIYNIITSTRYSSTIKLLNLLMI